MKLQRSNVPKRDPVDFSPRLHITRIPNVGLVELQAAMEDVIWWHQHQAITREDRAARDDAFVRLMQVRWHVQNAIQGQVVVPQADAA